MAKLKKSETVKKKEPLKEVRGEKAAGDTREALPKSLAVPEIYPKEKHFEVPDSAPEIEIPVEVPETHSDEKVEAVKEAEEAIKRLETSEGPVDKDAKSEENPASKAKIQELMKTASRNGVNGVIKAVRQARKEEDYWGLNELYNGLRNNRDYKK